MQHIHECINAKPKEQEQKRTTVEKTYKPTCVLNIMRRNVKTFYREKTTKNSFVFGGISCTQGCPFNADHAVFASTFNNRYVLDAKSFYDIFYGKKMQGFMLLADKNIIIVDSGLRSCSRLVVFASAFTYVDRSLTDN